MTHPWIADRTLAFDSSGIRKVFDLASKIKNPVNLSIGQPDFDVPQPVQEAMISAIRNGKNNYSVTQGIPELRQRLKEKRGITEGSGRDLFVCSGTSGGLNLSMMSMINEGDEVIFFDPYFVMYPSLVRMAGGIPVPIDCAEGFQIDVGRVEAAITDKTKMIILNSPSNPTGVVASEAEIKALAELAEKHQIALLSDEIYSSFCYDAPFVSPSQYNDQTIVIDGLSKSHAMTGLRVGWVEGPAELIETMLKLQQYTFVCAPHPAQWGGVVAVDTSVQQHVDEYRIKRDMMVEGLKDLYEIPVSGGAFYLYPKVPWGDSVTFVEAAIEQGLLVIPGSIFSQHKTHFRISYAATQETLERGMEILRSLAKNPR